MDDVRAAPDLHAFASARLPLVLHAARLITDDRDRAADLAVEAMRTVYARWSRLPDDGLRTRAALSAVARSALHRAGRMRSLNLRVPLELQDTAPEPRSAEPPTAAREYLPTADTVYAVRNALRSLTERERIEIVLYQVSGVDLRTVSRVVRRPIRTVSREIDESVSFLATAAGSADPSQDAALVGQALRLPVGEASSTDALRRRLMESITADPPRRGRSRWVLVTASAGVVLAVVAGAIALDQTTQPVQRAAEPDGPTSPPGGDEIGLPLLPATPSGLKLVGFRGMMLTVPEAWRQVSVRCERTNGNVVIFPKSRELDTCVTQFLPGSTVSFGYAGQVKLPSLNQRGRDTSSDPVVISSLQKRSGGFVQFAALLDADVVVSVRSEDRRLVSAVISSVQRVPPGYAAVPACLGLEPVMASSQLAIIGLHGRIFADSSVSGTDVPLEVVVQTPDVGTILPLGTQVNLAVVPR